MFCVKYLVKTCLQVSPQFRTTYIEQLQKIAGLLTAALIPGSFSSQSLEGHFYLPAPGKMVVLNITGCDCQLLDGNVFFFFFVISKAVQIHDAGERLDALISDIGHIQGRLVDKLRAVRTN